MSVLVVLAIGLWTFNLTTREVCAAAEEAQPTRTGRAAFYDDSTGNCSLGGAAGTELYAAVSTAEYGGSRACGGYLDVTGPRGTVRVQVVDRCPTCRQGELDLSRSAFARVAEPALGVATVVYHSVRDPKVPRPLAFRVKPGSSAQWLAVQVIDHGNPLKAVEIRRDGAWRDLTRGADSYWVAAMGAGAGPFRLRVSDAAGHREVVEKLELAPGEVQRSTVRLYGQATASPTPDQAKATIATPVPRPPTPAPTLRRSC